MCGLHITGTLSEQDAGKIRQRHADAVLLVARYAGIAALIGAIGYLLGNLSWLRWW